MVDKLYRVTIRALINGAIEYNITKLVSSNDSVTACNKVIDEMLGSHDIVEEINIEEIN